MRTHLFFTQSVQDSQAPGAGPTLCNNLGARAQRVYSFNSIQRGQSLHHHLESKRKPAPDGASAERKGRGTSSDQICSCSRGTNPEVDETESIDGRRRLELPATQGDEAELEDIVKIGQVGGHAKLLCSTSVLL